MGPHLLVGVSPKKGLLVREVTILREFLGPANDLIGYHETVGPVKESAVWVEEAAPPVMPWGRRPMSPAAYTPPDPLGLSTEGDECKFPEDLHELFPDGLLISLSWEGDVAWEAITIRKDYLISLLNKVKEHFRQKENEGSDKGRRRPSREDPSDTGEWSSLREWWCGAACGTLADEDMIIAGVELFAEHMRTCLLPTQGFSGGGGGTVAVDMVRARLTTNLRYLREAYDTLLKLDLPSQPLTIVEKVIFDYRVHGMTVFLQRTLKRMKTIGDKEIWKIEEFSDYGAITNLLGSVQRTPLAQPTLFPTIQGVHVLVSYLFPSARSRTDRSRFFDYVVPSVECDVPSRAVWSSPRPSIVCGLGNRPHLLESYIIDTLSSINKCVASGGRRESALFAGGEPTAALQRQMQQILLAYVQALRALALQHTDQDFNNSSLSVALDQRLDESQPQAGDGHGPSWQQRLLIAGANAQYTRRVTLTNIATAFESHSFPKPTLALQAAKEALIALESTVCETYLEHKGDPLVGTIEPSMYMGRHKIDPDAIIDDARPYVYEIINNLIAVHAEVDSVCGSASSRYVRDICETVCEELARLAACTGSPHSRASAFQARLEYRLLHLACAPHLTRKAENYLMEALAGIPPLDNEEDIKHMDKIVNGFKKRMHLQLASLNCNTETV
ncbi:Exocyst complex component 2 [Eumeta japonica]|uniref:Exocyst complex component 2 n=1 Tax=Eumeta variegata TaxID=151549 RepID=A0A4C2A748_EUMVA|nr:Exocyst complex component 2 [Eumeta japonica]